MARPKKPPEAEFRLPELPDPLTSGTVSATEMTGIAPIGLPEDLQAAPPNALWPNPTAMEPADPGDGRKGKTHHKP